MREIKITRAADIEEIERVPFEERLEVGNTYDLLKKGAAIDPGAPALSFILSGDAYDKPIRVNYRDFLAQITRTANLFHDLGVGPRDVVSYLLPNLPQTHFVLWGAEAAGIVNPINPLLEPSTIAEICRSAGTKVLVALGELPGTDIWGKVAAIRRDIPGLKAIVRVIGPSDEADGVVGFDEVIGRYGGERLDSGRRIDPRDIASIYHTGGTTGTPKLAVRTHLNEVAMVAMLNLTLEFNTGETTMCGLPLFHVNGTTVTGVAPFSLGAHVVLLSPRGYREPTVMRNFYKIVEHYRPVSFSSVPTVLSVLLEIPKEGADIGSLRYAGCGAAPLSTELFRRFEEHSGMKILEGYGLTEGVCVSSINPFHGERKVGSIGLRLPYQQMKILVVDEEGRSVREAKTDEIGSVCIKGPNVFKGYLEEAHNKGIWAAEGWLNTGDLGRQDADGYFWLTGRKKDLIIRGGHNIDPAAIEEPLYRLQGVKLAAAVGQPDAHAGEIPVVFVTLQEGAALGEEQIIEYLRREIGERAAIPRRVFVVGEIPLTPIGKIFKPALRWDAIRRVFETELEALREMAETVEVKVAEDRIHGASAVIGVKPVPGVPEHEIRERVKGILARYTVHYRLELAGAD